MCGVYFAQCIGIAMERGKAAGLRGTAFTGSNFPPLSLDVKYVCKIT